MLVIQRYITLAFLSTFAFSLTILTLLFFVGGVFQLVREDIPLSEIALLVPYLIPYTLPFTIPVALLLACSLVYGQMVGDNEVTALKASGLAPGWLALTPIAFGAALAILSVYLQERVIPDCRYQQKEAVRRTVLQVLENLQPGESFRRRFGTIEFMGEYNGSVFRKVVLIQFGTGENGQPGNRIKIVAQEGRVLGLTENEETLRLSLSGGSFSYIARDGSEIRRLTFDETDMEIPLVRKGRGFKDYTGPMLRGYIDTLGAQIQDVTPGPDGDAGRERIEYVRNTALSELHRRWSLAAAPITFLLLGIPIPFLLAHPNRLVPFFIAFVVALLLFYLPSLSGQVLGKRGFITPWVGAWAGHALVIVVGAELCRRAVRR